jgi:hypothetical protein
VSAPDWQRLAAESCHYRDTKGFKPVSMDTAPYRLMNIFCELEELVEELANDHDSAAWRVRFELSDVVRYCLTTLVDLGNTNWTFRGRLHGGSRKHGSPEELTAPMRRHLRAAMEAWRRGRASDVLICLELVIVSACDLRDRVLSLPGSIETDVMASIAKSMARPHGHGGKDLRA